MDARLPAILGGQPAFDEQVLVGRPNVGDRNRLFERLNDALDRRQLTNHGTFVQALEVRLADTLGVRHCVAVCNATTGLGIAARALDLRGEVIVPAFTFIATAHALSWIGLTPVFADIDPETCTLDARSVESKITSRTTGNLRRPRLRPRLRRRQPRSGRAPSQPDAVLRCRARLPLLVSRRPDRPLRPLRGLQLPRDEVLQHARRRRDRDR